MLHYFVFAIFKKTFKLNVTWEMFPIIFLNKKVNNFPDYMLSVRFWSAHPKHTFMTKTTYYLHLHYSQVIYYSKVVIYIALLTIQIVSKQLHNIKIVCQ